VYEKHREGRSPWDVLEREGVVRRIYCNCCCCRALQLVLVRVMLVDATT
jgi:hypothetical protein